jgi:ribosome maturation factor RimP
VIELLDGEFARAGYEIEDVIIDTAARPPRITVIADGDKPLDLDSIAELSRSASEALDRIDTPPYMLEVTSPGVTTDAPAAARSSSRCPTARS